MLVYSKILLDRHDGQAATLLKALGLEDDHQAAPWPLPNMQEVSESRFWGWRASYYFPMEAWADRVTIDEEPGTLLIFYVNQGHLIAGGFAVVVVDRNTVANHARYFEWRACVHDFLEKTVGRCLHRYTCANCGASYDIDSSG